MARIMINRTPAALAASLGICLSGLSFSAAASAEPTCEAKMARMCNTDNYWQIAGYASANDCTYHQIEMQCPPFDHDGFEVALEPSNSPDPG